jgi:hypothetical protein
MNVGEMLLFQLGWLLFFITGMIVLMHRTFRKIKEQATIFYAYERYLRQTGEDRSKATHQTFFDTFILCNEYERPRPDTLTLLEQYDDFLATKRTEPKWWEPRYTPEEMFVLHRRRIEYEMKGMQK